MGHHEGAERRREDIFAAQFTPWDFRLAELATDNCIAFGMFEHEGDLKTRVEALEMMSLAEMDLRGDTLTARTKWFLAKGWLELLLDWSDEEDTVDLTRIFTPAMDVLPWRPTVHAARQARGLRRLRKAPRLRQRERVGTRFASSKSTVQWPNDETGSRRHRHRSGARFTQTRGHRPPSMKGRARQTAC